MNVSPEFLGLIVKLLPLLLIVGLIFFVWRILTHKDRVAYAKWLEEQEKEREEERKLLLNNKDGK